ncbi:hypothetical protein AXX00_11910 [Pseudomonas aeruginosa]|uniref:hypothetical protein n=3 Tax=Pseudomonas TaxID=286 RepID=UPI000E6A5A59|nr:hypothetical protein [Pseudomonas aeruginosa]RIZ16041.1 hypothetical protein AXX00_11910 [Pseudomonas aeruginosa]
MRQEESSEMAQAIWFAGWDRYWDFFYARLRGAAGTFQQLQEAVLGEDGIEELKGQYGPFAVLSIQDLIQRHSAFSPPHGFAELLFKGFDLKSSPATQLNQIDEYAAQVAAYGLDEQLCWMVPWLRGVYHYRREEFEAAMPHFQAAFENAKYRAGKNQYKLVNQYVEVAAKNDDRRGFKKGIEWAQYLDIKVRWLRDDEPTEEKLDYVCYMLKIARYDHQM